MQQPVALSLSIMTLNFLVTVGCTISTKCVPMAVQMRQLGTIRDFYLGSQKVLYPGIVAVTPERTAFGVIVLPSIDFSHLTSDERTRRPPPLSTIFAVRGMDVCFRGIRTR